MSIPFESQPDSIANIAPATLAAGLINIIPTTTVLPPDALTAHVDLFRNDFNLVREGVQEAYDNWREREGVIKKLAGAAIGSAPWVNLAFGEGIGLMAQGLMQAEDASSWKSFAGGVAAALAVETGFTLPVAHKNKEPQPAHTVAEAAAISLWMGGAMGAEVKELPIRQSPAAIGAYMIFGTALAAAAEINDTAETFVNQWPVVLPALVVWGLIKKLNKRADYKGPSDRFADRMVDRTLRLVNRVSKKQPQG